MLEPESYFEPPVVKKEIEDTPVRHADGPFEPTNSVMPPEGLSLPALPCISAPIGTFSGFSDLGSTAGNDKDLNLSSAEPYYTTDYPEVYVKEEIESASEPETHKPWIEKDEDQMRSFTFIKVEAISGMYDARQEEIENPVNHLQKVLSPVVEKIYDCDVYNKTFSNKRELIDHSRIHTGEKPYQCEYCKISFVTRANLYRHKKIHTGDKPYKCPQCKKCFSQGQYLKDHIRVHTREKPYECKICHKKFAKSCNLTVHKRTHTGDKPYECSQCKKCFSQGQNLKDHRKIHTREKPYECKICLKRFSRKFNLTVHLRIHGGKLPKCEPLDKLNLPEDT
ncbi:zinc finger protein 239-like [Artemia franciscana]|uniref:C2H2-type domain-containing protein n=1 Tax=Artemia franciscana TaxID=6661 RepID=A0AA88HA15_ARTSF|nr:hypothetical protein QYM36_013923 [Artemia franciscana]